MERRRRRCCWVCLSLASRRVPASLQCSYACRLYLLPRVIAGANEWTGFDVTKAHFHANLVKPFEFLPSVISVEGDVRVGRTEVLPQSENVDVHLAQVAHHRDDFLDRLSHAENHSGLGGNVRRDSLGVAEDLHHSRIAPPGPCLLVKARHRLGAVSVDLGTR